MQQVFRALFQELGQLDYAHKKLFTHLISQKQLYP